MALRRHRPIESLYLREVDSDSGRLRSSVADELYATRERYGVDLAYVANELRIPYDHLAAIEEGRFSDLPGPVYIVGFLRSYADYLGIDADEVIARFKAEQLGFAARQDLNFPSPHDDGRVPRTSLLVVALALAGAVYAGWFYVGDADRGPVGEVPEVPIELIGTVTLATPALRALDPAPQPIVDTADPVAASAPLVAEASPAVEIEAAPVVAEDSAVIAASEAPAVTLPASVEETTDVQVAIAVPAPVIVSNAYVPRVYGQGNADSVIRVRAQLKTWVQVTGANNELLLTRILQPGDVYLVPNRPGLVMMTGNAGGLEIAVGDKAAPSLGKVGAVLRRVALDPQRLLAGNAVD